MTKHVVTEQVYARLATFAVLILAAPNCIYAQSTAAPATLMGEWKVTSAVRDGKALDAHNFDGMRWGIGKDSLEVTPGRATPAGLAGRPALKGAFVVDDTKSPAHFGWMVGDGDRKSTINGIYELKGDVLRVCFARRGEPRPDGFETKGKNSVVYEFTRITKDAAHD
jgi:uncharacterized protein (TIGR03067 family)